MDYLLAAHIQVTGGAAAAGELTQVITQINNFNSAARSSGTGTMASDMDKAAKSGSTLHAALGKVGDAIIRMGTYTGLHMIVQGLHEAVSGVLDFDQAMTESLAIQQGVTSTMRGQMEDMAKSIAIQFGQAPAEVAKGFYYMASAGLTVEQQIATLPQVMAFAKAGMMDLDSATEMLFDALSALGQKSSDPLELGRNLTNLSDLLTEAAIDSQASIEQMGDALANKAGASIKVWGLDLKESIALLEVFADQGIKGVRAGTAFSNLFRDMTGKVQAHSEEWKKYGIEVFNAEGKVNSLVSIFKQFDAAFSGMAPEEKRAALAELGFTLRDMQTIMAVLGHSPELERFVAKLNNAGGVAQRVAENQMEALRSKLDQLKSVTMVAAIDGFEKLEEAAAWLVATFTPAVNAVIDVLGELARGAAPVATAFGGLVATAVVQGLQGIAFAVEAVFGAIAAHPGVVEGLGAALAGIAGAQIVSAIANIAISLGETLYLKALYAQDAINGLIVRIMSLAQTEGVIAAVRVGLSGLIDLLLSPVGIGIGIALAIYSIKKAYDGAVETEDKFRAVLEAKYDLSSIEGINHALDDMKNHVDEVNERVKDRGIFATWADVTDVREAEDRLRDLNQELANSHIGVTLIAAAFTDGAIPLGQWAEELDRAGINIKDLPIAEMRQKIDELAGSTKVAGASTQDVAGILEDLAKKSNIDIKQPMEKWVPQLTELYERFVNVRNITSDMGGIAEGSSTKMSSMEEAMVTLGDEAANAEDKLKALKTIMDGLSGGAQNQFDMTTKAAESHQKLVDTLKAGLPTFFATTEAGRAQRDALSADVDVNRDLALAFAETSGNMKAGAEQLQTYADGLAATLREAGLTETQIRSLLQQMGLTPEQIKTLFTLTENPAGAVADTNKKLDEAAAPRTATLTALSANIPVVADELNTTASMYRQANITAQPANTGPTDNALNTTARPRWSPAFQVPDTGTAEAQFNNTARWRSGILYQAPNTSDAEWWLNYTARRRTSYIDVAVSQISYINAQNALAGSIPTSPIAQGGIVNAYAQGGFENHVAQIGRMGHARLWNEPETGGEAYIPLALSKRARSMAIWEETGRLLGAAGSATAKAINLHAPINVSVDGASDPAATAQAVAGQVSVGIESALRRVLVEMRSG